MALRKYPLCWVLCALCLAGASAEPDAEALQRALSQREVRMRQIKTEWRVVRGLNDVGHQAVHSLRTGDLIARGSLSIDSFAKGFHLVFRDEATVPGTLPALFDFALPLETPIGYIVSAKATPFSSPLVPEPKGLVVTSLNFLPPRFTGAVVLTGMNPLRLLEHPKIWVENADGFVVVQGKLLRGALRYSEDDAVGMVLRIDPRRDMAVAQVELLRSGHSLQKAWVKRWKRGKDGWLPETVSLLLEGGETHEYALESVAPSTNRPPSWEGQGISDHRLGSGIGESVVYGFTWKLPDLTELRKMQEQQ